MESNQTQWLVDLELIKQLKARYYRFNDTQDWASFRTLFLDDAVYDSGNHVLEGRDSIVETFASGLAGGRTAHMAGLPEIEITSADTATGVWAFRDYVELATDREPVSASSAMAASMTNMSAPPMAGRSRMSPSPA